MNSPELIALKCPQCGGSLGESLVCGYCGTGFKEASAPEKTESKVVEKGGKKVVGEIFFNRWAGLEDSSLVAIAAQIAEETPKILAAKPKGQRMYTNFSLPLPLKPGRPAAYLTEVFKRDDVGFDVCLSAEFPSKTHQRVQAEGRVLNLPVPVQP